MKFYLLAVTALALGGLLAVVLTACGAPSVEQKTVTDTQTTTDTINTVTKTTPAPPNPTKTVTEQVKPPPSPLGHNHPLPPGVFQINRYQFLVRVGYEANIMRACPPFKYDGDTSDGDNSKTETNAVDTIKVFGGQYFLVACTASLDRGYYRQPPVQAWLPTPFPRTRGDQHTKTKETAKR